MLSRVLLKFNDHDLHTIYTREKTEFFSRALPIVTTMLLFLAGTLEVMYRVLRMGTLPEYLSIVNWACIGTLLFVSIFHSRCTSLQKLICPLLTAMTFLYVSFIDYDYTMGSIYYS